MRPPAFWWEDRAPPRALLPLAALAARVTAARVARPGWRAPVPVIGVGNVEAGGAGKTPVVMALTGRIPGAHVVTRGHGGRVTGPARVESRHDAADVGDEALLLAALAPTWVARDRAAGARAAVAAGARAILLDDGHQNPGLAKDVAVVVVDAARGWGNGAVMPAGPLREPVAAALARADLLLSVGDEAAQARFDARWGGALGDLPRIRGELRALPTGMPWAGLRALAFAGIGRPEKFFDTLRRLGCDVAATVHLADHQPIPPALFARLDAQARALGAQLVTTEKDAVRLAPRDRARVLVLPVRLHVADWGPLDAHLRAL